MANGSLRICLDPGHSINYNRGVIPGYFESNMNWALANYLKEELLQYKNTEVFITKSRLDSNPDLESRGRFAIQNNCEVFYSIHSNAASAAACGVSVFRSVKRPDSVKLGQLLGQKDVDIMKTDTGITYLRQNGNSTRLYPDTTNTDYYGVIRASVRSDVVKYSYLIEHGFHTNSTECTWLMNDANIRKLAKGEAEVLANYFNLQLKDAPAPEPTPTPASNIEIGDIVQFAGGPHYSSANATTAGGTPKAGPAKVTNFSKGAKHPYHIIHTDSQSSVYGWVDSDKVSKNGSAPTPQPAPSKVTVTYRVKAGGKWYAEIQNYNNSDSLGYAGAIGKEITDIAIKVSSGTVKYRVHVKGGNWLSYISKYDINDYYSGYAGNGKPIDAVEIVYTNANGDTKKAVYRVSPVKKDYYAWQKNNDKAGGMDGYAGVFGKTIDRLQISIE